MSDRSSYQGRRRPVSRAAALTALAAASPAALADDILWAGNQGCGGAVERGSWFDAANWFGFSVPGAGDRAILEEPSGSSSPPYIIHFGNFGRCPDGCGEQIIPGGEAQMRDLVVLDQDWEFDLGSGMEGTCSATPDVFVGAVNVREATLIGPDLRSASLTLVGGLISTEYLSLATGGAPSVGELVLADADATLEVRTTIHDTNIGAGSGNLGILRVLDGATASFKGQVIVGREGADAEVEITGGAMVTLQEMLVGSGTGALGGGHASMVIADGALLHCERRGVIGEHGGSADVTVDEATLRFDSSDSGLCIIGGGTGGEGELIVRGTSATCEARYEVVVGDSGGNGALLLEDGARLVADVIEIGKGRGAGEAVFHGPGVTARGMAAIGASGTGALHIENGARVSSMRRDGSRFFTFVGLETGTEGLVVVEGPGSLWHEMERLSLGGVWHSDTAGDGTVIIADGGRIECTEAFIASYWPANRGRIEVHGSGSTLAVSGGIALGNPGDGALLLTSGGEASCSAATFGPGATLHVEIGPAGAGALTASGPVTLSGALEVALAPGYKPSIGQEFTIITASSLDGDFATIDAPGFRLRASAGAVRITYCPCRADMDCSGDLSFFDFLAFQNLFAAADPLADIDGDGDLTFFDFLAFQNEFAAGCP